MGIEGRNLRLRRRSGLGLILGAVAVFLVFATTASAFVYWGNTGFRTAGRANLDGSSVNNSFIRGGDVVCGMASSGRFVYWANHRANTIGRALRSTGRQRNQNFITGADHPCGVAVGGNSIYWANRFAGTIGRANLDGSGVNQSFIPAAGNFPCGVAVNGSHVFWANERGNSIGRANLDGSGANPNFITGASGPCGVATNGSFVYWANQNVNSIGRANLDGSGANQGFITGADRPCGVAVNGSNIYWANKARGTIGVARLNGSGVNQALLRTMRRAEGGPCGVALDSGRSPTPPFRLGKTILHRKVGTATQTVTIPAPGRLVLIGAGITKSRRVLNRGGKWKMPVRPRGGTRATLNQNKRVTRRVRVKYIPVVGNPRTKSKRITLRKR